MMTIRSKLILVFSLFTVIAVVAGSGFVLQKATVEKSSYVKELNSLLVPQLRSELDQRLRALSLILNQLSETSGKNGISKAEFATLISNIKTAAPFIDTLILSDTAAKNLVIQINSSANSLTNPEILLKEMQYKNKFTVSANKFQFTEQNLAFYRSAGGKLIGLVFDTSKFISLTESSRGKDSFVVNDRGEILFTNVSQLKTQKHTLQIPNLADTGATIIGTDIAWTNGKTRSAYLTKSDLINNAYVMIVEDKVGWLTIAAPLLNSSASVLVILIIGAFIAALWLSKSLASPIEELSEQTARIGLGDWKTINLKSKIIELQKLSSAFNAMIENLQKRECDLKLANQKLIRNESLAAVGRIGAGVAHEVKNPLASILSYAQLLEIQLASFAKLDTTTLSAEKLAKIQNYNVMILEDTRRASRIINDLLTFARQKDVQTEKVNVLSYINEIKEKLMALCAQNGINFNFIADENLRNETFSIDKEQIYQVIYNLVQNAIHALIESNREIKTVIIAVYRHADQLCISVEDNGIGISSEIAEKIFEPFFSTKQLGHGSGLGLAISYGIMQMHGGQIQVSSEPNRGTKFKLFFIALKEKQLK